MRILITGGCGFIGSALIRQIIGETEHEVLNLDKLTYAGNRESLDAVADSLRYRFEQADICDATAVHRLFADYRPHAVMHLAAESHVDRSIDGPAEFINTNIVGTYVMLEAARSFWASLENAEQAAFRFHHISTDEVFGSLGEEGCFTETTPYDPRSPYSASKASSDHLVRAWHHTFGLPVLVTNCSNNYGPYQFPEKLIPVIVLNAASGNQLPVYGKGENVRDWLYVDDHARALLRVLDAGQIGETYNVGGWNEQTNLDVVHTICDLLDELVPDSPHRPHRELIEFVTDRPGHDLRYAIDASKMERELGWKPVETFSSGLRKTVEWYLNNSDWCERALAGETVSDRRGLKE